MSQSYQSFEEGDELNEYEPCLSKNPKARSSPWKRFLGGRRSSSPENNPSTSSSTPTSAWRSIKRSLSLTKSSRTSSTDSGFMENSPFLEKSDSLWNEWREMKKSSKSSSSGESSDSSFADALCTPTTVEATRLLKKSNKPNISSAKIASMTNWKAKRSPQIDLKESAVKLEKGKSDAEIPLLGPPPSCRRTASDPSGTTDLQEEAEEEEVFVKPRAKSESGYRTANPALETDLFVIKEDSGHKLPNDETLEAEDEEVCSYMTDAQFLPVKPDEPGISKVKRCSEILSLLEEMKKTSAYRTAMRDEVDSNPGGSDEENEPLIPKLSTVNI